MAPEEQDAAYLWDMQEVAKEAVSILGDKSVETFKKDKILCRAIERIIEIVGEAARKVSPAYQTQHPEIPWEDTTGCGTEWLTVTSKWTWNWSGKPFEWICRDWLSKCAS